MQSTFSLDVGIHYVRKLYIMNHYSVLYCISKPMKYALIFIQSMHLCFIQLLQQWSKKQLRIPPKHKQSRKIHQNRQNVYTGHDNNNNVMIRDFLYITDAAQSLTTRKRKRLPEVDTHYYKETSSNQKRTTVQNRCEVLTCTDKEEGK